MRRMRVNDHPNRIIGQLSRKHPDIPLVIERVRSHVGWVKREVYTYQAVVLYVLVQDYNRPDAHILEIGTAMGFSCSYLAEGAPLAHIVTLNPKQVEVDTARKNLSPYSNVTLAQELSWDYLARYGGPLLDMIFVDGDHNAIGHDLPWWNWLAIGGLMMFHDYAPADTIRPCPPVYDAVNALANKLCRKLDVKVIDDDGVGLVGLYRRSMNEVWDG